MEIPKINASKILQVCKGKLLSGNENIEIIDFSKDTRTLNKDDMYVAIKGEKIDGNNFVEEAFNKGAIGAIVDKEVEDKILTKYSNKVIIKVENTIKAIQDLAKYKRSLYNIPVIAVTGSVRKNKH